MEKQFFFMLEEVGAVIGDVMSLVSIYNYGASVGLINLTGCDTSLEQDMGWQTATFVMCGSI